MIGFIVAVVAGFLTPQAEGVLARPAAAALRKYIRIEDAEMRLFAFMLAMLAAGVAANLLGSGSTFWIILGGVLGYFGTRIISAVQALTGQKEG